MGGKVIDFQAKQDLKRYKLHNFPGNNRGLNQGAVMSGDLFYQSLNAYLKEEMEQTEVWLNNIIDEAPAIISQSIAKLLAHKKERLPVALYYLCSRLCSSRAGNIAKKAAAMELLCLSLNMSDFYEIINNKEEGLTESDMSKARENKETGTIKLFNWLKRRAGHDPEQDYRKENHENHEDNDYKNRTCFQRKTSRIDLLSLEILCSDYLLGSSLSLVSAYPEFTKGISEIVSGNVKAAHSDMNRSGGDSISDLINNNSLQVRKNYLRVISQRNASPLSMSCALAAWDSGVSISTIEKLTYYGHFLGIAGQIQKDYDEFCRVISDYIENGCSDTLLKITLPAIFILEVSNQRDKLAATMNKHDWTKKERELWQNELRIKDYRYYIKGLIKMNCEKSVEALADLPNCKDKEFLSSYSYLLC